MISDENRKVLERAGITDSDRAGHFWHITSAQLQDAMNAVRAERVDPEVVERVQR
jgi:hypothetical protein